MGSYKRGLELVEALEAAGITATVDPRSATPPCVLVAPPALTYDTGCSATAVWQLFALSPPGANADMWVALDSMADAVADVLPIERLDYVAYSLSPDVPALPAYRLSFTQGVDIA